MTATPFPQSPHYSPITTFIDEFVDRFENTGTNTSRNRNTPTMPKSSLDSLFAEPTALISDLKLIEREDSSPTASMSTSSRSSGSSSNSSSMSGGFLAKAIESANANPTGPPNTLEVQASIETPLDQTPFVVEEQQRNQRNERQQKRVQKMEPYIQRGTSQELARWKPQTSMSRQPDNGHRNSRQRIPRVTSACVPFEKTIPPTSFLREELAKDPAYRHALKAGTLWQSLVGQHVKLPALWFDGEDPARPYLGCEDPLKRNKWSYFGRHRVAGDPKLNALVKHSKSSGKLLLHIVCRDVDTHQPTEDIVVGVFHPNAEGVREGNNLPDIARHEDCRDVWIGHRSRRVPEQGRRVATRIESLLRYLHKNKVDKSPLGENSQGSAYSKKSVDNTNMNAVFGSRPPRHTLFVPEETVHNLLVPREKARAPPPSVGLLRVFLR